MSVLAASKLEIQAFLQAQITFATGPCKVPIPMKTIEISERIQPGWAGEFLCPMTTADVLSFYMVHKNIAIYFSSDIRIGYKIFKDAKLCTEEIHMITP
jgi:hypothetical protein